MQNPKTYNSTSPNGKPFLKILPKIIPYLNRFSLISEKNGHTWPKISHSIYLYIRTSSKLCLYITYLNTLSRLPILIHALPIFIHALHILLHWLGFRLSAQYLNKWNRQDSSRQPIRIEHPRTLSSRQPIRVEHPRTLGSRQPIRIVHLRTLGSWQPKPIRINYYVTRVVSQSESSILSPKISRLRSSSLLGSRLESGCYSLS